MYVLFIKNARQAIIILLFIILLLINTARQAIIILIIYYFITYLRCQTGNYHSNYLLFYYLFQTLLVFTIY